MQQTVERVESLFHPNEPLRVHLQVVEGTFRFFGNVLQLYARRVDAFLQFGRRFVQATSTQGINGTSLFAV